MQGQSIALTKRCILDPVADGIVPFRVLNDESILFVEIQSLDRGKGIGFGVEVKRETVGLLTFAFHQILQVVFFLESAQQ